MNSRNKIIRNLIIFATVVIASGWVGAGLNAQMGLSATEGLGMLVWIVAPLGSALVLRALAGDGWRDVGFRPHLRANVGWYAFSVLVYPAILLTLLGIEALFGWARVSGSSTTVALVLGGIGAALVPTFFKNIFEEFAWRGYLTPKVQALGLSAYAGHILVAVIWWAWHIPYWLWFIDHALLQQATPWSFEAFVVLSLGEFIALAIVLGELRLLTNSTWTAVLLHTVYNVIGAVVVGQGLIQIVPGLEQLAWLGPVGPLPLLLLLGVGIGLHRVRTQTQRRQTTSAARYAPQAAEQTTTPSTLT